MNPDGSEQFILNLLCSSDSSSDEDEQLYVFFSIFEQKLLHKRKHKLNVNNLKQRKTKRYNVENPESGSCKSEEKSAPTNFELRDSAVLGEYKEDVEGDLSDIADEIMVANIENWSSLPPEEFRKLFRMSRECFQRLLDLFEKFPKDVKKIQNDGTKITRTKMLLVFLLYAGHRVTMKTLSRKIKVFRNYYVSYAEYVLEFLVSLKANFVFYPRTEVEHRRTTRDFYTIAGLRNVIGCIDKVNFRLKSPYGNLRKKDEFYDIPTDMVCDASGRFMSIDLDILDSTLSAQCGNKYCFLASLKYSLREWTITPCELDTSKCNIPGLEAENQELHVDQQLFNEKFLATYAVLPRTIIKLQQRFRQLICIDSTRLAFARRLLQGCIVLYNLTIDFNDSWQDEEINFTTTDNSIQPIVVDPFLKSDVTTELERFKCPKGMEKREHMIYETCIFGTEDVVEQEIIVE